MRKKRYYLIAGAFMFSSVICGSAASATTVHSNETSPFIPRFLAKSAEAVACSMHSVGWCYAGVKQALRTVGVNLWGGAAWEAKDQLADDRRFRVVDSGSLHTGDILVHGRSKTHPYGHIAVYLGHDQEASDHVQKLIQGGSYGATVVFRPRTKQRSAGSSEIQVDSLGAKSIASSERPAPPVVQKPAYTSAQIAAARTAASQLREYYKQGIVSRLEAQRKVDQLRDMELACHLPTSDSSPVVGVPED